MELAWRIDRILLAWRGFKTTGGACAASFLKKIPNRIYGTVIVMLNVSIGAMSVSQGL
jgi:hypothetical protein